MPKAVRSSQAWDYAFVCVQELSAHYFQSLILFYFFPVKMSAFQAQEAQDSTETESHTTVLRDLKKTFQNLTCELQQLHMQVQ